MNWKYFIGIDVSKLSLDICVLAGKEKVKSVTIENDPKALHAFWKEMSRSCKDFSTSEILCCLEHTGIYNEHLLSFLSAKKVDLFGEPDSHQAFGRITQR